MKNSIDVFYKNMLDLVNSWFCLLSFQNEKVALIPLTF